MGSQSGRWWCTRGITSSSRSFQTSMRSNARLLIRLATECSIFETNRTFPEFCWLPQAAALLLQVRHSLRHRGRRRGHQGRGRGQDEVELRRHIWTDLYWPLYKVLPRQSSQPGDWRVSLGVSHGESGTPTRRHWLQYFMRCKVNDNLTTPTLCLLSYLLSVIYTVPTKVSLKINKRKKL